MYYVCDQFFINSNSSFMSPSHDTIKSAVLKSENKLLKLPSSLLTCCQWPSKNIGRHPKNSRQSPIILHNFETVVNKLIERIEIYNNEKKHFHNSVKADIYFTEVGLFDIPTEQQLIDTM